MSTTGTAGRPPVTGSTPDRLLRARRRASVVAVVAGLSLLPWFAVIRTVVPLRAAPLGSDSPDAGFIAFYVENISRLPWRATLFTLQWVIVLVLFVAVARAVCPRWDVAGVASVALSGAATAVYVVAEGVLVWPVVQGEVTARTIRRSLDPGVARALVLSRDGLHAPAGVLLGVSVLLLGWLLLRSGLWGRWVMAAMSLVSGGFASTSIVVGPEGLGPGLIFVLWGVVVPVLLLVALRRTDDGRGVTGATGGVGAAAPSAGPGD